MDPDTDNDRPWPHTLLTCGLLVFVICPGCCFFDFLAMNLFSNLVVVFAVLALYGLVHYVVWGWAVSATTAADGADEADARPETEEDDPPPD